MYPYLHSRGRELRGPVPVWGIGDIRGPASVVPAHEQVPAGPGREPADAGDFVRLGGQGHPLYASVESSTNPAFHPRPRPNLPKAPPTWRLLTDLSAPLLTPGLIILQALCPSPHL